MSAKDKEKKDKFLDKNITKEEKYENYRRRKNSKKRERDKKEHLDYWN